MAPPHTSHTVVMKFSLGTTVQNMFKQLLEKGQVQMMYRTVQYTTHDTFNPASIIQ